MTVIRNNTRGRTALRFKNTSGSKLAKSLERLSSGYMINRSADNASGLAVSEKMRALMTGLSRAEKNSQEGIDLIDVGEGTLGEIHDMLNRAAELADTSANGTYNDEIDREALQAELDQLCNEIDRITKNANFNTIRLFQDKGLEYEVTGSYQYSPDMQNVGQELLMPAVSENRTESQAEIRTLDDLLANRKDGQFNIIYTDRTDMVQTTQSPAEGSVSTLESDITINGQKLSDILKTEIIPNTVNNILTNYPAFSYLNGSNIGIGLEYFNKGASGGTMTLAYVKGQPAYKATTSNGAVVAREDYITYTLGVNTAALSGVTDRAGLEDLEATIAHEMIHAFMDEATTVGMFGVSVDASGIPGKNAAEFPDWFVEGMAQTASGPGNWLKAMGITAGSSNADIANAIAGNKLGSGSTASEYGTGYLACMYLGSKISGNGIVSCMVDAQTVSSGLASLFNKVIGGSSLDNAIRTLTDGKFTSCSDFVNKFNAGSAEISSFVHNLVYETGSGRGGIISGDLKAQDLTPDTSPASPVGLFELDTDNNAVRNLYPDKYNVYSGGSAGTSGTAPTDFTPGAVTPPKEFGDLVVTGAKDNDIEYDWQTGVLTVKAAGDIKISMKAAGSTSTTNKIILAGTGKVALNGVSLSATDAFTINGDAEVIYQGKNDFGGIKLDPNVKVSFTGAGQLKTAAFSSDATNTVSFINGAVIVGNGSGTVNAGEVVIDNASVAATISLPSNIEVVNSDGNALKMKELPWDKLSGLSDVASIKFDGADSAMVLDKNDPGKLWFDPSVEVHRITVTDSNGKSKVLAVEKTSTGDFQWMKAIRPFTVSGGTEGTDWAYENDDTLVIMTDKPLTISGGIGKGTGGNDIHGRIRIKDDIVSSAGGTGTGDVKLTLDGVESEVSSGCAFDLGKGNNVTLTLKEGKTSVFTSGSGYAGISLGAGTSLTINDENNNNDINGGLNAKGGDGGAGIGRSKDTVMGTDASDKTSSITINGGSITAEGGDAAAGIGSGDRAAFGNITINDGTVNSTGGEGGAGIGGANYSPVGNIEIKKGTINAVSKGHGAGIGGGWYSLAKNGTITISGGDITASSMQHGTGIGAGCQGTSQKITITGDAHIIKAAGGNSGAGIGSSWKGTCGEIEISGNAVIDEAVGGTNGAGIGAGSGSSSIGSKAGDITIDTTGSVSARGGVNGVGIGSGYSSGTPDNKCGNITIKQGTVEAIGSTDSTGIGAGRDSKSGNITIGDENDPSKKVVVTAIGGMTNNGGNILSYTDRGHTTEGKLTVYGDNTSIRPGNTGEGLYSTSSAIDKDGERVYAYPVYLFEENPPLDAGVGLTGLPLPAGVDRNSIKISAVDSDGKTKEWKEGLSHEPLDSNYVFLWMTGKDQKLTIEYKDSSGTSQSKTLDLEFFDKAGVFRTPDQKEPSDAEKPEYHPTKPDPVKPDPVKPDPVKPDPTKPDPAEPTPKPPSGDYFAGGEGIILQIGANSGEILEIPRFYLSLNALGMGNLDISTQKNAWESMPVIENAINRVSSIRGTYGALSNRLEHNQENLRQASENITAAESRIRDTDMAREMMEYLTASITSQSAQAMLAQSNQSSSQVLQLLR